MAKVMVVTDSSAQISAKEAKLHDITVVPLNIHFGDEIFKEGEELSSEEFFQRAEHSPVMPSASAPSPAAFSQVYRELHKRSNRILSLHVSSKLSKTLQNARLGAEPLMGRCDFALMDSMTISVGLGVLVKAAAKAAKDGASLDDIVRLMRGMIPHIYLIFYAESMDYLERSGRIGKAQAILGTMLNIKPMLFMEDGELIPLEKVRTIDRAIEKLNEFVAEFSEIEETAIIQRYASPTKDTKMLLERLKLTFPNLDFPIVQYNPLLATHIGPNGMGIVVHESINAY